MNTAGDRLRLRASDPARLRDYLRSLGLRAEVDHAGLVAVEPPERKGATMADYLHSWSVTNGVELVAEQAGSAPPAGVVQFPFIAGPRLGDMLVQKGLITAEQLQQALEDSRTTGKRLGEVLLERQWLFEDELARTLAGQLGIPYVNLRLTGVDHGVVRMLPAEIGIRFAAVPIGVHSGLVRVAFADPTDDESREAVAAHIANIQPAVAELSDIRMAWRLIEDRRNPHAPSAR